MRIPTLAIAVALLAAAPAPALNLLVNGDFDDPPSVGWSCGPNPLTCTPSVLDVDGSGSSGSAFLATEAGASSAVRLSQCIPIVGSTSYDFLGWALVSAGNTATTTLRLRMEWYDDTACTSLISSEVLANAGEVGVWTPLARNRPSPPDALSGRFEVHFFKSPSANGVVSARVDALFVPEPAAFSGALASLGALLAIAAAAVQARR